MQTLNKQNITTETPKTNQMNSLSSYTDHVSIGLSALCVLHCLATPLLLVLLPSLSALHLDSEAFHSGLLLGVIPISLFSLMMGCKRHKFYRVLLLGGCGLLFMVAALFMEGFQNGELLEKILTIVGAGILALGHYLNFRLCQRSDSCECPVPS